jgi:hypothetical protein
MQKHLITEQTCFTVNDFRTHGILIITRIPYSSPKKMTIILQIRINRAKIN